MLLPKLFIFSITTLLGLYSQPVLADKIQEPVPAEKLGKSEYCGLCHTEIYQQWNASSHHFSSFNNPVYRKVVLSEVGTEDEETLRFCAGCHDPLLLAANKLSPLNVNSWPANSGITCLSCHRMTNIGEKNGDYVINEPILHPFALADNPSLQKAHEFLLKLSPWLHRSVMSKPIYKEPEFCATCHTLEVPASINGHTNLKVLDEYRSWSESEYNSASTGHESGSRKCQDCHMPLFASKDPAATDGMAHSHSFAAGNTTLAAFNQDLEHLEKAQQFLSNGIVELQLLGLRTRHQDPFLSPGEIKVTSNSLVELKLSIFNKAVGHHFPAGTADSNQAWLSLVCVDAEGHVIAQQGNIDTDNRLPDDAVRFGVTFVDAEGNPTNRRTTTTRAVALQDSFLIPPRRSREVQLGFALPPEFQAPLKVKIKLNWRKYDPKFIDWVFDGRPTPPQPITTITELEFELPTNHSLLAKTKTLTYLENHK